MFKAEIIVDKSDGTARLYIYREIGNIPDGKVEILYADGMLKPHNASFPVDKATLLLPIGAKEALLKALLSEVTKNIQNGRPG